MRLGYKLATEAFGPKDLIRQAVLAEQAGFDSVELGARAPAADTFQRRTGMYRAGLACAFLGQLREMAAHLRHEHDHGLTGHLAFEPGRVQPCRCIRAVACGIAAKALASACTVV